MQFADFTACIQPNGAEQELKRLREKHILSEEQANAIDLRKIEAFFQSKLFREEMKNGTLRREFKFSVLAPAAEFYPEAKNAPAEMVLLQGVIDCLVETEQGFHIIDFKTDHVSRKTAPARAESYAKQLDAYAYAVKKIFEKPVVQESLYFFDIGQAIARR